MIFKQKTRLDSNCLRRNISNYKSGDENRRWPGLEMQGQGRGEREIRGTGVLRKQLHFTLRH